MGFRCGIVGLPNVGKSTLFNALTQTALAVAANYPFSTVEPNIGRVPVPDPRLDRLGLLAKSAKIVPTTIEFVDIAGLVRGASKGEGLGNQFLANIREVDAIAHVVRCFDDGAIVHVEGSVDPIRDVETIETELMLADLAVLERRRDGAVKRARGGEREAKEELVVIAPLLEALAAGTPARRVALSPEHAVVRDRMQLLTAKPVFYVANVDEASARSGNAHSRSLEARAKAEGAACVTIAAAIEAELASLASADERAQYLAELGLDEPGLNRVIRAGYGLLGLITFFTAGPKEAHAWTVPSGALAPDAAGAIHTDFQRGFIRAETIAYDDFAACGGEQGAKEAGKMRQEGKDYRVKDGDVMLFRFNV